MKGFPQYIHWEDSSCKKQEMLASQLGRVQCVGSCKTFGLQQLEWLRSVPPQHRGPRSPQVPSCVLHSVGWSSDQLPCCHTQARRQPVGTPSLSGRDWEEEGICSIQGPSAPSMAGRSSGKCGRSAARFSSFKRNQAPPGAVRVGYMRCALWETSLICLSCAFFCIKV